MTHIYHTYNRTTSLFSLLLFVCTATAFCAAELTFKDNFEGTLDHWGSAHGNWQTQDGVLIQKDAGRSAAISFPEPNIAQFDLSYTAIFNNLDSSTATGFTIDRGIGYWLITIQGDGQIIWSFIVKGEKAGLFHGSDRVVFQKDKEISINVLCENNTLKMKINGQEYLVGPATGSGGVRLKANRGLSIDNVHLTYDTSELSYPNLQINGSFEFATNQDIPDYWTPPGRWTRMNHGLPPQWRSKTGILEFREKWFLDNSTAFEGGHSLRVQKPLSVASFPMRVTPNTEYTVSVYLKSDRPNLPIRLAADYKDRENSIASSEVNTGTTWQRHTLHLKNYPHDQLSLSVSPQSEGLVWVDAVQIEQGLEVTDYTANWYDSGFSLPKTEHIFRPPPSSYRDKTHKVILDSENIEIPSVALDSSDSSNQGFLLNLEVTNNGKEPFKAQLTTSVEVLDHETQLQNRIITLSSGESKVVSIPDFTVANDRHRARVMILLSDEAGNPVRKDRLFLTVPHPFRVYPEYSHYNGEKTARIAAIFDGKIPLDAQVEITTRLALQRSAIMGKTETYPVHPDGKRQLFDLPINTPGWQYGVPYKIDARLLDNKGKLIASSESEIITQPPRESEIRINHINRGLYLNGAPYLPYGVSYTDKLPGKDQVMFDESCGFNLITALSHRSTVEQAQDFLSACEEAGIKACLTHLGRKYSIPSDRFLESIQDSPALVLFTPSDETGLLDTYEDLSRAQNQSPSLINFINENTAGYQKYSDQLRGFPGPVLSCDRYPLIHQSYGWPQTRTDVNGIYSFEERIEWMDQDGIRDRKPLHYFLQGAEHRSRLPTPEELTWLTYIPLVNHCMAFTYFAGIPLSAITLESMIDLNQELQELKPALFSLEEDPLVTAGDDATKLNIRFLAKQVGDELTIICVNRALYPVTAQLDLSSAEIEGVSLAEVLFENRSVKIHSGGKLQDQFQKLERHVYKIQRKYPPDGHHTHTLF